MKRWMIFIAVFLFVFFWGFSWLASPAQAHRHHSHSGIWIGPPIIFAPPPIYYRPYITRTRGITIIPAIIANGFLVFGNGLLMAGVGCLAIGATLTRNGGKNGK